MQAAVGDDHPWAGDDVSKQASSIPPWSLLLFLPLDSCSSFLSEELQSCKIACGHGVCHSGTNPD